MFCYFVLSWCCKSWRTQKNGNIWKITYRFKILGYAYIKFIFNDIHVIYYLQITLCFSLYKHCHVTLANGWSCWPPETSIQTALQARVYLIGYIEIVITNKLPMQTTNIVSLVWIPPYCHSSYKFRWNKIIWVYASYLHHIDKYCSYGKLSSSN